MGPQPKFRPSASITAPHFVKYDTPSGLVYHITGVAVCSDLQGKGDDWHRDSLTFQVPIPALPTGKWLRLKHWAPSVSLNTISNDRTATNAGWAIDSFHVVNPNSITDAVTVSCDVATRDADGFILRLGYSLHLLGDLADAPKGPK